MMDDPGRDDRVGLPMLITGMTGVAGWAAYRYFARRFGDAVFALRPPGPGKWPSKQIVPLDVADEAGLKELFERHQFRSVLNAAGNCALKACELNPEMAERLNVRSARIIAELADQYRARLVHLSSDLVFSGAGRGNYVETDPVDPVTVYGKTMAEGERRTRTIHPRATILRISLPMGISVNRHAGAIDWIASRFRPGRPATLYFDEIRTPFYVADFCKIASFFLSHEGPGIYHLGGPRALSLYRIGQIVNRVGGYRPELLRGCPRRAAGPMPPRAGDVSMNIGKLTSLLASSDVAGWSRWPISVMGNASELPRPWPLDDSLVPDGDDWHLVPWDKSSERAIARYLYRPRRGRDSVGR